MEMIYYMEYSDSNISDGIRITGEELYIIECNACNGASRLSLNEFIKYVQNMQTFKEVGFPFGAVSHLCKNCAAERSLAIKQFNSEV